MQSRFVPAKLLLSFVNEGAEKLITEASWAGDGRDGVSLSARTLPDDDEQADYYPQDAIITLLWGDAEKAVATLMDGVFKSRKPVEGVVILVDVPSALEQPGFFSETEAIAKGEAMKSDSLMIVSITNHGEAEYLMKVARKAGAKGGTIINARGTGTEEDLKYFGISLSPEKELLAIISDIVHAENILTALRSQPLFSEPGGGIIFTVPVERILPLRSPS